MKIKWIRSKNGYVYTTDITEVVEAVNWSGSVSQAARTAEITVVNAPDDKNIQKLKLNIGAGDVIKLYENDELIFYGEVQTTGKLSQTGTVTHSCVDLLSHLLRSNGVYNFSDTTAEGITKKVCNDFQIGTGTIAETKATIKKMIIDDAAIYDIIMMAYTKAARQTGKKYICRMDGSKLSVEEKGTVVKNFVLSEGYNITNTTYEETIENMVNVVKIYDDKGKQIGEVKKDDWIEKYGIYQQIYKKEKGVNETAAAKQLFVGIEKKVSLDGIDGDLKCVAGNGVIVYDDATGLNGLFWIDGDTHTWQDGIHTMQLDLNFKNIMDSKEYNEEKETKKKKGKKAKAGDKTVVYYTARGDKYHKDAGCGGMITEIKSTMKEAIATGREKCKKCW